MTPQWAVGEAPNERCSVQELNNRDPKFRHKLAIYHLFPESRGALIPRQREQFLGNDPEQKPEIRGGAIRRRALEDPSRKTVQSAATATIRPERPTANPAEAKLLTLVTRRR
jgi:hypothetical protein